MVRGPAGRHSKREVRRYLVVGLLDCQYCDEFVSPRCWDVGDQKCGARFIDLDGCRAHAIKVNPVESQNSWAMGVAVETWGTVSRTIFPLLLRWARQNRTMLSFKVELQVARTIAWVLFLLLGVFGGKANWRTSSLCWLVWVLRRRTSACNFFGGGVRGGLLALEEVVQV